MQKKIFDENTKEKKHKYLRLFQYMHNISLKNYLNTQYPSDRRLLHANQNSSRTINSLNIAITT